MAEESISEIFETYPSLEPLGRFAQLIPGTPWFRHIGDPLDTELQAACRGYAEALGFPEAEPAVIALWKEAAGALENTDINPPAWEEEEQLRAALTEDAVAATDETALGMCLNYIAGVAADAAAAGARDTGRFLQIDDENFERLATGAAAQVCHQAALVLIGGGGPEHPFSLKYRLFEHGRWPLGIIGTSLNIF